MNLRALAGVPEGSALLEIGGAALAVSREGAGVPVVCLHAVGHGGGDYAEFAARVRDRFEVIRIDWPGQGRSGPDPRPPAPARYARLLGEALNSLGVERPIIIGNSIGGAAALHYASEHPVRALVLCNPGGLMPVTPLTRRACAAFARFFAAGERRAWWFAPAFGAYNRWLVLPGRGASEQRRCITAAGYEVAPALRQAWNGFSQPDADIRGLAAELDVPVWFAWAARDRLIPLKRNLPAIRAMKQATLSTFKGGHAAFLEAPAAFAEGFFEFYERHALEAAG